jgi:hypothetical protein
MLTVSDPLEHITATSKDSSSLSVDIELSLFDTLFVVSCVIGKYGRQADKASRSG